MSKEKKKLFAVFAEADEYERPLILIDLTFARLIDDVVVPYEKEQPFFIDGAPISRKKIQKLKIVRLKEGFKHLFSDLHWRMRESEKEIQKLYGDQYHVRLEAALREGGEDVTSQVIKAFDSEIKPKLKDYLPKREELIKAASSFFWEGIRRLSNS